jgi:hypothetical protein
MKLNEAATQYAVMRQEADGNRALYMRAMEKSEEAGLSAVSKTQVFPWSIMLLSQ